MRGEVYNVLRRLSSVKQAREWCVSDMDLKRPQIEQLLRSDIEQAGGLSQWAHRTGLNREHLSRVLHGHKPLGPEIMRALGLEEVPSPGSRKVLSALREEIERAGTQLEWARRTGVNRTTLNQVINGRRKPTPDILRALNVQTVVAYQSKRAKKSPLRRMRAKADDSKPAEGEMDYKYGEVSGWPYRRRSR